jgi:HAD superfamily hydrolase (TIGR01509 family)
MPGVIFDVDGTLVDNSFLHTLAWYRACRDLGVDASMVTLHRLVGMGGDQFVPALLGREMPDLDEAHGEHMKVLDAEAPLIDGAGELMLAVRQRGLMVVVATSAGRDAARSMLQRVLGDPSVVQILVTSDDVASSKPAPDLVAVALQRSGLDGAEAVFIGDTRWDVEASGRAGVACIAVRSGGWAECELRALGAAAVYENAADVLRNIATSPIAALSG